MHWCIAASVDIAEILKQSFSTSRANLLGYMIHPERDTYSQLEGPLNISTSRLVLRFASQPSLCMAVLQLDLYVCSSWEHADEVCQSV